MNQNTTQAAHEESGCTDYLQHSAESCPHMRAQVLPTDFVPVRYSVRPEVGQEFLTLDVPNGWEDVRPLVGRVLLYEGRLFTFRGWNSDRNECFFSRTLVGPTLVAIIGDKV